MDLQGGESWYPTVRVADCHGSHPLKRGFLNTREPGTLDRRPDPHSHHSVTSGCRSSAEERGAKGWACLSLPPRQWHKVWRSSWPTLRPGRERDREFCEQWGQLITSGDACGVQG